MSQSDTKQKILESAEHLFAREGFHCTSLRQITSAAEVNLAAVNYHFGSKETLLEAVLARRLEPLNQQRCQKMNTVRDAARQSEEVVSVKAILRAFLEPTMALREPDSGAGDFVILIGRGLADPSGPVGKCFIPLMQDTVRMLFQMLCESLPTLDAETVFWRMQFAIGSMSHTMRWAGNFPGLPETLQPTEDNVELTERLLGFITAGMEDV